MSSSSEVHTLPLSPPGALLTALDALKGKKPRARLTVPVYVTFGDAHRIDYGPVVIGARAEDVGPGAIHVDLDDTGLMSPLLEKLAKACPAGAPGCAFWFEGHWGTLIEVDLPADLDPPGSPKRHPFTVLKLGERITDPAAVKAIEVR
jgi:hypothetical protein